MPEDYSVKINRRDGVVEITGADKEWIDQKLKELAVVYKQAPAELPPTTGADRADQNRTGQETPEQRGKSRRAKRATGRVTTRTKKNVELEKKLTTEVKKKLEAFVDARRIAFDNNLQAQSAILATYLLDELGMESIDHHDLYTVYSLMGWQGPANPRAALINAQQRNGYFTGFTGGKTQLTHAGENFGRHGSLRK